MKTLFVILSLATISLFSYNEVTDSQMYATLSTPRINILRLKFVPGCNYLKPVFVYEKPGEKQFWTSKTGESKQTSGIIPSKKAMQHPREAKWFFKDLNTEFMHKLKFGSKGC